MKITQDVKSQIYEIAIEKNLHLPTHVKKVTEGRTNNIIEMTLKEGKELLKVL